MAIPGFTAHLSFYTSTRHYATGFNLSSNEGSVEAAQTSASVWGAYQVTGFVPPNSPGAIPIHCPGGLVWCQDGCVNTNTDPFNCGRCNHACGDQVCCNGKCIDATADSSNCGVCGNRCPSGYICCSDTCKDYGNDANNCGGCNVVCPPGATCCAGKCCASCCAGQCCPAGATCVSGRDPNDPLDRSCRVLSGTGCDLAQFQQCFQQAQQNYHDCLIDFPPNVCNRNEYYAEARCNAQFGCLPGNGFCCPSGCSHLRDNLNCGACGNACAPGQTCCSGNCTNLNGDTANCGSCGNACPAGYSCCGGVCTDLGTNANCGACGKACAPGQACCSGTCVNTTTDSQHCGACGNACVPGVSCTGGRCPCPPGPTSRKCGNCGTQWRSSCNSDGSWSWSACTGQGACAFGTTQQCNGLGAQTCGFNCTWGNCVCIPGATLCNGTCVNLMNDASHCGNCNTACQPLHTCAGGRCSQCEIGQQLCGSQCYNPTDTVGCCGGRIYNPSGATCCWGTTVFSNGCPGGTAYECCPDGRTAVCPGHPCP